MTLDVTSRNQLRALVFGSDAGLSERLLEDPEAWRELIVRAKEADQETTDILREGGPSGPFGGCQLGGDRISVADQPAGRAATLRSWETR